MATALVYARPWNLKQMKHLADGVWGNQEEIAIVSEHKSVDSAGFRETFEREYSRAQEFQLNYLNDFEADDIILRCRLLRSLPRVQAQRLLVAAEHAAEKVITEVRPNIMLSITVDSYVIDIFSRLCEKFKVLFVGLVPSFINNHFRITTRGEYVAARDVTKGEVELVRKDLLDADYKPDFLVSSERDMISSMLRRWLKSLPKPVWFYLKRLLPRERLNYHFWASQVVSTRYWSLFPRMYQGYSGATLSALCMREDLPLIYVPLQMSPEATIDYWSQDTRWVDYENFLLHIIRKYRGKCRFLVKEHPNVLGHRSRNFYKKLEAEENCALVSPKVSSNSLLHMCQGVLVCTGTVGFEAVLRGKRVFSDSEPYYVPPGTMFPIECLSDPLAEIPSRKIENISKLEYLLRCTLPGKFINDGTWSDDNSEHLAFSISMAQSIRYYIENYNKVR